MLLYLLFLLVNNVKMALHMSAFIYLMDLIYLNHTILWLLPFRYFSPTFVLCL